MSPPIKTPQQAKASSGRNPEPPVADEYGRKSPVNLLQEQTPNPSPGRRRVWLVLAGAILLLLGGLGLNWYLRDLEPVGMHRIALLPAAAAAIPPAETPTPTAPLPANDAAPIVPPIPAMEPAAQPVPSSAAAPASPAAVPVEPDHSTRQVATSRAKSAPADVIKITRNHQFNPGIAPAALAAYQAYMEGDDRAAGQLYRELQQSDARNTDALLGLAAIAARQGDAEEAVRHYLHLLELDPGNAVAQAGVIALLGQADPLAAESRLKILLARQPDAGYLHAALGGIHAGQGQWADAQQAYFQAFRLEPGNAEHAYNLAVSLDQLGKPALALDYYHRARALLNRPHGAIDRAGLDARIAQLSSGPVR